MRYQLIQTRHFSYITPRIRCSPTVSLPPVEKFWKSYPREKPATDLLLIISITHLCHVRNTPPDIVKDQSNLEC